jgi:peptidoglycan/xylan/chitin deacetylase (PgdA/CDA1 family)
MMRTGIAAALLLTLLYIWGAYPVYAAEGEGDAPSKPTVYLTFDDGPSKLTPQVLDLLKEYEVQAKFFVLGQLVEEREETVRRIVEEGHAIGNHTYDHRYKSLYGSFLSFFGQVEKTGGILTRITGKPVRLLRAPGGTYGNFDDFYFRNLREAGYSVFDWNVDSGDSKRRGVSAEEIIRNVKNSKPAGDEVVVLLHDGSGHEESVKALPEIIRYYMEKGYRFGVLDESIKPVTFRAGKLKWDRVVTEHDKAQAMLAVSKHNQAVAAAEAVAKAKAKAEVEAKQAASAQGQPESQEWVALRDWAAGKGTLTWNPVSKKAELHLGGGMLEFSPIAGSAVASAGANAEHTLADGAASSLSIRFEHNRFYLLKTEADAILKEYQSV